ncbi:hypothetical protein LR48_Vigan01g137500 [Vigna angularis]|uniref:Uncharacterized protein n=1 Tax=Phaseolus angularis TaxID=3914 RepID=A0A0L9TNS6_PHAAN|nr:hypothetical protein LR48_Vigan01g137500 [Vigna angularis]
MCDDGGRGEVAPTVDATAARTQRRGRSGEDAAARTRRVDLGGWRSDLGGWRSDLSGWRSDLGTWRGGGQICDERRTTRGDGGGRAEEVSDGGEEGGNDGGYAGKLRGDDGGGAEEVSDGGCWQASWGRWWWPEMLLLGEEQRNPCAKRKKFDLKRFSLSPCSSLLLSFCFLVFASEFLLLSFCLLLLSLGCNFDIDCLYV